MQAESESIAPAAGSESIAPAAGSESVAPAADPRIGEILQERYCIVSKLGEGGMGSIYEAEHQLIGRRVAVKCLHKKYTGDPEVVERFRREARAATSVGNEHIIDVTDMGDFPDGTPFFVMEHLEGRELADVIEYEGPLTIGRTVRIARQVCEALAAAHGKHIVHRDLKPENIFIIRRQGNPDFVKVLDFGVSKMRESAERVERSLTKTGITMGTPHYMSPEQAQGSRETDHRTDIYALGVIVYLALTGDVPFDGDSLAGLMVKVMTAEPPPMRRYRSDIPESLEAIVGKMLAKHPEDRFTGADEVAQALAPYDGFDDPPVRAGDPSIVPPKPFVPRSKRPEMTRSMASMHISRIRSVTGTLPDIKQHRRWLIVAAALLGVGGLAALAWTGSGDIREKPKLRPAVQTVTPPPAKPEPVARSVREEVRVRIAVLPEDAELTLDGTRFPSPLDAARPRSLEPVTIRITREGYQPIEELTVFDRERELEFVMEPVPAPRPKRALKRARKRRARSKTSKESSTTRFREDF